MSRLELVHPRSKRRVQIPSRLDRYVPCVSLERRLVEQLTGGGRGLTVVGPGGSGKTRLVQEVCGSDRQLASLDVVYCNVSEARTRAEICQTVSMAVGASSATVSGEDTPLFQLRRPRGLLLILDSAEAALHAVRELVPGWLSSCGELVILVTSRAPLSYEGEHLLWIEPMATSTESGESTAETLFRTRVAQFGGVLPEGPEAGATLANMLEDLGGLPLAIELAAAQLHHLSLFDLAQQVHTRPETLQQPTSSVEQCFNRSWDLLSSVEQATLAQLSVFPDFFSSRQAAGVVALGRWPDAPSVDAILAQLVRQSLVLRQRDTTEQTRFRLLHPIRTWARTKLAHLASTSVWLVLSGSRVNMETGAVESSAGGCELTSKELELLRHLVERPHRIVPRDTLFKEVWGYAEGVVSRTLDTTMRTLRKKVDVGDEPHLKTARRVGYGYSPSGHEASMAHETRVRHARWHLEAAGETWRPDRFTAEHRRFQADHFSDLRTAARVAAEIGDPVLLEGLLRRGIHPQPHPSSELPDALARLADTDVPDTRKVLVDAYLLASAPEAILKWTSDIPADWPRLPRYSLGWCRAAALFDFDVSVAEGLAELRILLEVPLSSELAWVKASAQAHIARWEVFLGGFDAARAVLKRPDLPFSSLRSAPDGVADGYQAQAILALVAGDTGEALSVYEASVEQMRHESVRRGLSVVLEGQSNLTLALHRAEPELYPIAEVEQAFEEVLRLYQGSGSLADEARALTGLARTHVSQGDMAGAAQRLSESQRLLKARAVPPFHWLGFWRAQLELSLASRDLPGAARALRGLRRACRTPAGWMHTLLVAEAEAALCAARGDRAGAAASGEQIGRLLSEVGCAPDFPLWRVEVRPRCG